MLIWTMLGQSLLQLQPSDNYHKLFHQQWNCVGGRKAEIRLIVSAVAVRPNFFAALVHLTSSQPSLLQPETEISFLQQ